MTRPLPVSDAYRQGRRASERLEVVWGNLGGNFGLGAGFGGLPVRETGYESAQKFEN